MFQSTHPRGVRLLLLLLQIAPLLFQSTHPRGVRPAPSNVGQGILQVSIHAPTRGATQSWNPSATASPVSIHAPTRGATMTMPILIQLILFQSTHPRGVRLDTSNMTFVTAMFQSTHPRGVRLHTGSSSTASCKVSIHAPTRGATPYYTYAYVYSLFQSTHPRGVRPQSCHREILAGCFNPRTHEGCDSVSGFGTQGGTRFNPRTHEGCDLS